MNDQDAVEAVVSQYARFGWKLERILLKEPAQPIASVYPDTLILPASRDALWFSRESGEGRAWELRRLTGTPFALVRVIPATASEQERDEILSNAEAEMADRDLNANCEISNGN